MPKTLILGVGNLLLADDGIGVRVIQKLQTEHQLPEQVEAVDGGTCGLDLLHLLEGVHKLIVVDAAELGLPPGTIKRMEGEQVPAFLVKKMSPHEINLPELLFSARLTGIYPEQVVVIGIQIKRVETSLDLSPEVEARLDELVEMVLAEVAA